jgi:hypothetical protein
MDWSDVGTWLKDNAGTGAALVGSLLTGNVPGAVAAGVALVTTATGEARPDKALAALQAEPSTMLRLRELAIQEEASIREHIRAMTELQLKDAQAEHEQTQLTIRSGDNAEDKVVRRTRPLQSWASLVAGFAYVFTRPDPSMELTLILFTLPWAYAGLRQVGKGMETLASVRGPKKAA